MIVQMGQGEVPAHHKAIAGHLRDRFSPPVRVLVYRDNQGKCPIPVFEAGPAARRFYSTIGLSDRTFSIPKGRFEFAALGKMPWLPNAVVGSTYWLRDRRVEDWPLVCEDVVRHNARSPYRHMAYVPAAYAFQPPGAEAVRWLLGTPVTDADIGLDRKEAMARILSLYPEWLTAGMV